MMKGQQEIQTPFGKQTAHSHNCVWIIPDARVTKAWMARDASNPIEKRELARPGLRLLE
jgi:hypothetical protein